MSSPSLKTTQPLATVLCVAALACAPCAYAKGLVGKLPGNPASCHEEPCSTDPQHVLAALKVMSVFLAAVLLLPLLLYYMSKLLTKIKSVCCGASSEGQAAAAAAKKTKASGGGLLGADGRAAPPSFAAFVTNSDKEGSGFGEEPQDGPHHSQHKGSDASRQMALSIKSMSQRSSGSSSAGHQHLQREDETARRWLANNVETIQTSQSNQSLAKQHDMSPGNASVRSGGGGGRARARPSEVPRAQNQQQQQQRQLAQHRHSMFFGIVNGGGGGGHEAGVLTNVSARSTDRRRASHAAKQHQHRVHPSSELINSGGGGGEFYIEQDGTSGGKGVFVICASDFMGNAGSNNINNSLQIPTSGGHQHRHSIDSSTLNSLLSAHEQQQQQQHQVGSRQYLADEGSGELSARQQQQQQQQQMANFGGWQAEQEERQARQAARRNRSHSSQHQRQQHYQHNSHWLDPSAADQQQRHRDRSPSLNYRLV